MKRITVLLAFLCFAGAASAAQLNINKFAGLDADNDPLFVRNGMAQDSRNIVTDSVDGLGPRPGFSRFSTQTCTVGPWEFPHSNGTRYMICFTSNAIMATTGGTNFNVVVSSLEPDSEIVAATLGDAFYWASSTGLRHWDGTRLYFDSTTLTFTSLASHKGRLFGIGVAGDLRTIYGSKYLDGKDFALVTNPVETDPVRIQVQGSLDESLAGLFSSYQDALLWFKANSFGAVHGDRRSNFKSVVYSPNVGSAYPESVKDCDGELRFLGSKRTVWGFNGARVYPLTKNPQGTDGIKTVMDGLIQGDANSRSWTQTSATDWGAGSSRVNIDTTSSPGDVILQAASTTTAITDNFNDGDYTNSPAWTVNSGTFNAHSGILKSNSDGSIWIESSLSTGTWRIDVNNPASGNLSFYFFASTQTFTGTTIDGDAYYMTINVNSVNLLKQISGVPTTMLTKSVTGVTRMVVSRFDNGVFIASYTKGGQDFAFDAGAATDTTDFASKYFAIYTSAGGDGVDGVSANPFGDVASSTFTSQAFNMGLTATSWGLFLANATLAEGSAKYIIYSDTNSNLDIDNVTTFVASQTIANLEVPTIPISSYVVVAVNLQKPFSTLRVTLHDFTIHWTDGNQLRTATLWTNQRYWLGCAIGNATTNNTVLVLDRNRQWQYWTGVNMSGAAIYNGNPYFGNIGGVFQAESGFNDAGTAIPSYFKTQYFYPGTPNYKSVFDSLYLTTMNSAETMQTQYYVDGVNTSFNLPDLDMDAVSGYQDVKLPFSATNLKQGNMIAFLFTVNGTTNWRLLNASLYFEPEKVTHE